MIRGLVVAVPDNVVQNKDAKFSAVTGVHERCVAKDGQTVVTLAEVAAKRLMKKLGWQPDSLCAIIFLTQTPSVRMPAMACMLANAVGAKCPAFDVNMACSGYVYGLWLATALAGRVLLVTGDVTSRYTTESDAPTRMLFGDAVAVTAVKGASWANWRLGTDGSGAGYLLGDPQIKMDGSEVFNFALRALPPLVEQTTLNSQVDWYLLHQANKTMLQHLGKKSKIPPEKMPINIDTYGNTSSASIPLLMADSECTSDLLTKTNNVAMFGFGAGWSWGGVMMNVGPLPICEVVRV